MRKIFLTFSLLYSLAAGAQDMEIAKAECEKLLHSTLPLAERMLQEHGEFFPYGAALKSNDEVTSIAGYDGRENPPSNDIIRLLKDAFVQGAISGEYKATALVYDVKITLPSTGQQSNALAVSMNHRDNYSVIVYLPYKLINNELIFGETLAQQGESDIFTPK